MTQVEKEVNAAVLYQLRLAGNGVASCASYFGVCDMTIYRRLNSPEYYEVVDSVEKALEADTLALHTQINKALAELIDEGKKLPLDDRLRILNTVSRFMG